MTMKERIAGFQWDDGNWPKCGGHGLTRDEIEFVLSNKPFVAPDPSIREQRFNAVGTTSEGRFAFVVFTLRARDADLLLRPISARYMHKKEVDNYEQRKRT